MSTPRAGRGRALACLAALTLALKLCVILAPPRDLWPDGKGCDEELWRGTSAKELIDGPLLPLLDYQINDFSGGSLVVALIDVPLFLAFGPTVVAMRLATIPFHLLAVVCLFAMLDRWVGRRAAWAGGILLAMPPPGYAIVSATAWGTHMEGIALGLLLAWLWLRARAADESSRAAAFGVGLVGGFALYFGYLAAVILAALALLELASGRALLRPRALLPALAGFALGFAPWIGYNATHGFRGLSPYNRSLGERVSSGGELGADLRAAAELATGGQAEALYLPDVAGVRGDALEIALAALLGLLALAGVVAFLLAGRRDERPRAVHPAAIALAYLPLFALAYVLSDFRIRPPAIQDYRYAMPPYPWIVVLAATAVARARSVLARRAAAAAVAVLALAFGAGTVARCELRAAPSTWSNPGWSDTVLARTIFLKFPGDEAVLGRALEQLATRPPERQHQTLFVLGQNYRQMLLPQTRYGPRTPPRELFERGIDFLRASVAPPLQPYFERPAPGERSYGPSQRELFWADRKAREAGSPPE